MRRIDGESGETDSRELLGGNSPMRRHVFGLVQIPGANGSSRATADQQALGRIDLDLSAATGDFPQGLGISTGRAVKNQHRGIRKE